MSTITIYDSIPKSACGCGSAPNTFLTTFTFESEAINAAGGHVVRHTFENDPMAFTAHPIGTFVADKGVQRLPAVVVDGEVVLHGRYPRLAEMAEWSDVSREKLDKFLKIPEDTLPMAGHAHGGTCGCGGHGHGHGSTHSSSHGTCACGGNGDCC